MKISGHGPRKGMESIVSKVHIDSLGSYRIEVQVKSQMLTGKKNELWKLRISNKVKIFA